jgi:hypothetical protein
MWLSRRGCKVLHEHLPKKQLLYFSCKSFRFKKNVGNSIALDHIAKFTMKRPRIRSCGSGSRAAYWPRLEAAVSERKNESPDRGHRKRVMLRKTPLTARKLFVDIQALPSGAALSAPLVPLERFAIRLKRRRIASPGDKDRTHDLDVEAES